VRGAVIPLAFGLTVQPDPPYQRLIELLALREQHGFEHRWTHDSHGVLAKPCRQSDSPVHAAP
jgi:hypothetical protein